MKNWSIKAKLIGLCASLLTIMMLVSGLGFYTTRVLEGGLDDLNKVQIPSLYHMALSDMAHDGLRAVVFKAMYVSTQDNMEAKKEMAEELKEFTKDLKENFEVVDKLELSPAMGEATTKARPFIDEYIKAAEEVVGLALSGHRDVAVEKMDAFQKSFSALAEKFDVMDKLAEKDTVDSSKEEEQLARYLKSLGLMISLISLLVGGVVAIWIVRNLNGTLSKAIEQLSQSGQQISMASTDSASSANMLSEAATQQAASLQETMASVEEISAMVNQNAESAGKVKTAVDQNQQVSEKGSRSVDDMIHAIGEIKQTNDQILGQMETSNREFSEIVKIISEIGEKTKVINDIVFQTKLLSFNASVEAARAGEHGKGFAVVAEEVGNLAQMSGNAAKQITDMLSTSIQKVNEIVQNTTHKVDQLVEVGKDKIAMGQSTAQKCREALNEISQNANSVASMIAEITNASKEQAQGVQEINKAVTQMDQVTQQNSTVAQKSAAQAEQLKGEAQALAKAVENLAVFTFGADGHVQKETTPGHVEKSSAVTEMKAHKKTASRRQLKVVGSNEVPSHNDPNFEEF